MSNQNYRFFRDQKNLNADQFFDKKKYFQK